MKKILYGWLFLFLIINFSFISVFAQDKTPRPTESVPALPSKPIQPVKPNDPPPPPPPQEKPNPYENDNWNTAWGSPCDPEKDIMLNIHIPFIGRCIKKDPNANQVDDSNNNTTVGNAFPKLMWGMIRLVMTAIYIIWFLWILVGWFMITASGVDPSLKEKGKKLIMMIIWWLILLGASGIILNLVNPNFFWTSSPGWSTRILLYWV